MAKVFIEETTLTNIGDAIRGKEGTTELIPVNDMATRITAIETGTIIEKEPNLLDYEFTENGVYDTSETEYDGFGKVTVNCPPAPTDAELTLTGNCSYRFAYNGWNWIIDKYEDRIITNNITNISSMFQSSETLTSIPFEFNIIENSNGMTSVFNGCHSLTHIPDIDCKHTKDVSMQYMFNSCYKLKQVPKITTAYPNSIDSMFIQCRDIREIPEDFFSTWNFTKMNTYTYAGCASMFSNCWSLRKEPNLSIFNQQTVTKSSYSNLYSSLFNKCISLDEVTHLPVMDKITLTSNMFSSTVENCYRLKNFMFETNADGTPKVCNWKAQTLDLSKTGYGESRSGAITSELDRRNYFNNSNYYEHNSGITLDKFVYDDESYQRLKDDPDWFSARFSYSPDALYDRYNWDSAVATINSLPDTSQNGVTNTIKFKKDSGASTDAGSFSTHTDEEIAALSQIATDKGWTVSLV